MKQPRAILFHPVSFEDRVRFARLMDTAVENSTLLLPVQENKHEHAVSLRSLLHQSGHQDRARGWKNLNHHHTTRGGCLTLDKVTGATGKAGGTKSTHCPEVRNVWRVQFSSTLLPLSTWGLGGRCNCKATLGPSACGTVHLACLRPFHRLRAWLCNTLQVWCFPTMCTKKEAKEGLRNVGSLTASMTHGEAPLRAWNADHAHLRQRNVLPTMP